MGKMGIVIVQRVAGCAVDQRRRPQRGFAPAKQACLTRPAFVQHHCTGQPGHGLVPARDAHRQPIDKRQPHHRQRVPGDGRTARFQKAVRISVISGRPRFGPCRSGMTSHLQRQKGKRAAKKPAYPLDGIIPRSGVGARERGRAAFKGAQDARHRFVKEHPVRALQERSPEFEIY